MLRKLTDIGFRKVGIWSLANGEQYLEIEAEGDSANMLYSFVVDRILKYISKTVQPLKKRMCGYRKPVATQSTNIRNNGNIKSTLENVL